MNCIYTLFKKNIASLTLLKQAAFCKMIFNVSKNKNKYNSIYDFHL